VSDTTGLDIIGIEITLTYDPSVLTAIDAVTEGTIASEWIMDYNITDGQIIIAMASSKGLSNALTLVNVNFSVSQTATGGDTSPLTLARVSIGCGRIPVTTTDGLFTTADGQDVCYIDLYPGWNLISLCLDVADPDISSVLSPIAESYRSVWTYDAYSDTWEGHVPNGSPNSLISMNHGSGYWIDMIHGATLPVVGSQITETDIYLYQGWNLAGYNHPATQEDVEAALGEVIQWCTCICTYDSLTGTWLRYIIDPPDSPNFLNNLSQLGIGKGYWINVSGNCEWE
jgi:hypothetical protein